MSGVALVKMEANSGMFSTSARNFIRATNTLTSLCFVITESGRFLTYFYLIPFPKLNCANAISGRSLPKPILNRCAKASSAKLLLLRYISEHGIKSLKAHIGSAYFFFRLRHATPRQEQKLWNDDSDDSM